MEKLLCPSLLNLSDDYLKDEVQKLDRSGADILHLDVMDGGVTWEVLRRLWGYGVEGFVLGKQILFGQNEPYDKIIQKVRSI